MEKRDKKGNSIKNKSLADESEAFGFIDSPKGKQECILLLVQGEVDGNSYRYGSTHHRVVTHTQEAHHLNVGRH